MKSITVSVDDETYHEARSEATRRQTSVSGLVREALRALSVASQPLKTSAEAVAARPTAPFWKPLNLNELVRQQGVSAVNDLDEISDLWPADDDPDELLNHILTGRKERRALRRGAHGEK